MTVSHFLSGLAAFVSCVLAADLTFANGANCTGTAIYGATSLDVVPCTDMTDMTTPVSVILANIGLGQTITFYSDDACLDNPTDFVQDTCYTPGSMPIGSFTVTNSSVTTNTDVVPYGIKLSNYTGLAQTSPYDVDVTYSHVFMGFGLLAFAGAINLSAFVAGCQSIDPSNPDPVALFVCIAVPIATLIAAIGGVVLKRGGQNVNEAIEMATGTINNVRRSTEDYSKHNEMYMDALLNTTVMSDFQATRIGHLKRDLGVHGVHMSPVLEFDGPDNTGKWHYTAHYHPDSQAFIHHIQHSSEWDVGEDEPVVPRNGKKPYGYNVIRWTKNGIDATYCPYSGKADGWGASKDTLFKIFYRELKCYAESTLTKAKYVQVDLHNKESNIVGEMHFAGYQDKPGMSSIHHYKTCLKGKVAPVNGDCVAG